MIDGVDNYWVWFAIGLALAALELLAPGVYLIWLAAAALITPRYYREIPRDYKCICDSFPEVYITIFFKGVTIVGINYQLQRRIL